MDYFYVQDFPFIGVNILKPRHILKNGPFYNFTNEMLSFPIVRLFCLCNMHVLFHRINKLKMKE